MPVTKRLALAINFLEPVYHILQICLGHPGSMVFEGEQLRKMHAFGYWTKPRLIGYPALVSRAVKRALTDSLLINWLKVKWPNVTAPDQRILFAPVTRRQFCAQSFKEDVAGYAHDLRIVSESLSVKGMNTILGYVG
jgi:hypothetical protein